MLENVHGLPKRGCILFKKLVNSLNKMGYIINYDILQVADYGIPQTRKRLVLLGGKNFKIPLPQKTHSKNPVKPLRKWVSLREAIGRMPIPYSPSIVKKGLSYEKINWNVARELGEINKARIAALSQGESRYAIPEYIRPKCHQKLNTGFANVYGRLKWDEPSSTITRGCTSLSMGKFGHPEQERALSVREAANIQTFPKNYKFKTNSIEKACIMIGNAFPCKLAKILGEQIIKYI